MSQFPLPRQSASSSKANILVVDDTPANISLLTQLLSSHSYKVRVAPNGQLALQSARFYPPDLILLDIKMPEMDGYEVCRRLKADPVTCHIPVIFISALDAVSDKVSAFTCGGSDYITKPFEPVEVIARIENQLRLLQAQAQLQIQNDQLQLLLATTEAMREAADVESALAVILAKVCQTIGWDFGEAWIPQESGEQLEYCQAWYEAPDLQAFDAERRQLQFSLGQGVIGQVWRSQQLCWIADVHQSEEVDLRTPSLWRDLGIQGMMAIPIVFNRQVLAVLAFFQRQVGGKNELSPQLASRTFREGDQTVSLELIQAVATQLGSMMQRKNAEDALKQANLELERLANLDGLTQVANRRCFDQYLSQEWQRLSQQQHPLSLILFDVDYFKCYNDYFGHQAGDDCLRQIASLAHQTIQFPKDLVARYGGEEFAMILPETGLNGAIAVAKNLQAKLAQLNLPQDPTVLQGTVTISLGIASLVPQGEATPYYLVAAADMALYQAKQQGRDRLVCASSVECSSHTQVLS